MKVFAESDGVFIFSCLILGLPGVKYSQKKIVLKKKIENVNTNYLQEAGPSTIYKEHNIPTHG